jgi:hypothetical protein
MMESYIASIEPAPLAPGESAPVDDRSKDQIAEDEANLYNISNFSL